MAEPNDKDFKLVVWVIVGLVIFWAIAIPALALSKPFGDGSTR